MVFSNLHIIQNSRILMLIKLGLNRLKNGIGCCNIFYSKKRSIFFETPCVFDIKPSTLKHLDA